MQNHWLNILLRVHPRKGKPLLSFKNRNSVQGVGYTDDGGAETAG